MRRFSQRNSLVTLSEINITPLLDLAFVLLIIFVITTPLLEQGLALRLPATDNKPETAQLDPNDVKTVDVDPRGYYLLGKKQMTADAVAASLLDVRRARPNLIVYIRADENGPYKHVATLLARLERAGLDRVSLRTSPTTK